MLRHAPEQVLLSVVNKALLISAVETFTNVSKMEQKQSPLHCYVSIEPSPGASMSHSLKFMIRQRTDGSWEFRCLTCFRTLASGFDFSKLAQMGEAVETHSCRAAIPFERALKQTQRIH
jgi:hypothetical protein